MAELNIFAAIEGIISQVPESVALWQALIPAIAPAAAIPEAVISEIHALMPLAHAAVDVVQNAVAGLQAAPKIPAPADQTLSAAAQGSPARA